MEGLSYVSKPYHIANVYAILDYEEDMNMPEALSLQQFVAQQLESGRYQSYEEMVQAGLRLLQEREQEYDRIAECVLLPSASKRVKQAFLLMPRTSSAGACSASLRLVTPHEPQTCP